jgi:hypothetical protein
MFAFLRSVRDKTSMEMGLTNKVGWLDGERETRLMTKALGTT